MPHEVHFSTYLQRLLLIVEGFFQSYFIAVFDGLKYSKFLSICLASFIFAQFHLIYGIPVVLLTFLFSFILGWFYEYSRSLVGVSIIHFLTGAGFLFCSQAI